MLNRIYLVAITACLCLGGPSTSAQLNDPIPESIEFGSLTLRVVDWVQIPNSSGGTAQINMAFPSPDGTGRVFVNDQRGFLYVINGDTVSEYFDVYSVLTNANTQWFFGTGLSGFTFHPDFANNGIFYTVHLESPSTGIPDFIQTESTSVQFHTIITEWTALDPSANTFSGSHVELLRVETPGTHHSFQQMGFNPTAQPGDSDYGMLYIAQGDGDILPSNRAQSLDSPHGSILRLDTYGNNGRNGRYGVPEDNPFANDGDDNTLGEIWAYGFRNPHRIGWDSLTGTLYAADIGENQIEEVNIIEAGANYGWNVREGAFLFNQSNPGVVFPLPASDAVEYTYPVLQYDHDEGRAISGGYVYRGGLIPELYGKYLFGDLYNGRMYYADVDDLVQGQQATVLEVNTLNANDVPASLRDITGQFRIDLKYGYDANNEILVLTKADGKIRRLESTQQQPDSDGDGVVDALDNCLNQVNASQLDTNGDGFGNACDPDLDNNGIVNFIDFSIFQPLFGQSNADADFNGDGVVNFLDLSVLANFFLQPPGPSGQ
ncbi:MAG: PQQ-dependent sugar dehydrogenase [Gammaproteobacteria bacterium]